MHYRLTPNTYTQIRQYCTCEAQSINQRHHTKLRNNLLQIACYTVRVPVLLVILQATCNQMTAAKKGFTVQAEGCTPVL